MTADTALSDLMVILRLESWAPRGRGPAGELWSSPEDDQLVGVPTGVNPGSFEWRGIIERVAAAQRMSQDDLSKRIERLRYDVTDFRVDGPSWEHSVPVEVGFNLFKTARQMLRSSATTSRTPKAAIKGSYSIAGDRILARSRFGQTQVGSYVVPLMVPVYDKDDVDSGQADLRDELPRDEGVKLGAESSERRATRTMAEALSAVWTTIVKPDQVPGDGLVHDLVTSGVTRELLQSIQEVLTRESVHAFDAQFHWSEVLPSAPLSIESSISIPREATEVIQRSVKKFRKHVEPVVESFTGPVIQMRDEPILADGFATIDTARKGRKAEISFRVPGDQLGDVHGWFKEHETLLVEGIVRSSSNRLLIDKPERVVLLADTVLSDN